MTEQLLVATGAAIFGLLGAIHLLYTFRGTKFDPRAPAVAEAMRGTSPNLTRQTTMWKAWIGFNASHSLGALAFAAVYLILAIGHGEVLRRSTALLSVALVTGLAYLWLAKRYWFRTPLVGIAIATACFAAALLLAHLQSYVAR